MVKQRDSETVEEYAQRFRTTIRRMGSSISEMGKISFFERGLLRDIYSFVVLKEWTTLEEIIENAKKTEISINYMKKDFKRIKVLNMDKGNTRKGKRKRKPRCYKCKTKGHTFIECKE